MALDKDHPFYDEYERMKKDPKAYKQELINKHSNAQRNALIKANFPGADGLTKDQLDLIFEPQDAPENFYHDGEVSESDATLIWINRMMAAELKSVQIKAAVKFIFPSHKVS